MIYESLLLLAVLFIAGVIFHLMFRDTVPFFQAWIPALSPCGGGNYFTWFWTHGGQTLPMQTWKFRVITADGERSQLQAGSSLAIYLQ